MDKYYYKKGQKNHMFKKKRRYTPKYSYSNSNSGKKLGILIGCIALILVITICVTVLVTGTNSEPKVQNTTTAPTVKEVAEETPFIPQYSANKDTVNLPKSCKAEYGIIINKKDNSIVAQKNPHKRAYPASTTKIMTLLVACENMKSKDDTFKMTFDITNSMYVAGASVAGFKSGEKITVEDLMYGTILPSGADAAIGLAIKIAGSEENFVKLMNEKVAELKLENTHFTNVTGLHHKDNYSSVYDMAVILDVALQNELCKEILSTYQHTTNKTPENKEGILLTSTLFKYMYGTEPETATILGGKTGYLTEAGYCIASFGEANDSKNEYIVVTFDSPGLWPAAYGQIDLYKKFAK